MAAERSEDDQPYKNSSKYSQIEQGKQASGFGETFSFAVGLVKRNERNERNVATAQAKERKISANTRYRSDLPRVCKHCSRVSVYALLFFFVLQTTIRITCELASTARCLFRGGARTALGLLATTEAQEQAARRHGSSTCTRRWTRSGA